MQRRTRTDRQTIEKARRLIHETRVMTLAVCRENDPWSAPVYFVFQQKGFYFFSSDTSRHIRDSEGRKTAASVFQDADRMEMIFGFQMSGTIARVTDTLRYVRIVNRYAAKFSFLKQVFGPQVTENHNFFLERFKSRLYGFYPDRVVLSDNSKPSEKRSEIDLGLIS